MGYIKWVVCSGLITLVLACGKSVEVKSPLTDTSEITLEVINKSGGVALGTEEEVYTLTQVSLTLNNSTEEYMELDWVYGDTEVKGLIGDELSDLEKEQYKVYQSIVIPLKVWRASRVVELKDFESIARITENNIFRLFGGDSLDLNSDLYHNLKAGFEESAASPELLLNNFFPEVLLFFDHINRKFSTGKIHVTDSVESPFGSGYLFFMSDISINKSSGKYIIDKLDKIPDEQLEAAYRNYLQNVGEHLDTESIQNIPLMKYIKQTLLVLDLQKQLQSVSSTIKINNGHEEFERTTIINVK